MAAARPTSRPAAAWQRGGRPSATPTAPPPPRSYDARPSPPSALRHPPPPQRLTRASAGHETPPSTRSVAFSSPASFQPGSPALSSSSSHSTPLSEYAIQIRGRARQRSSGSPVNGRAHSESPSKGRHSSLCARPRFVLSMAFCLVVFSLLFFTSLYTHREEVWRQIGSHGAAASQAGGSHSFRLAGITIANAQPIPNFPDVPVVAEDVGLVVAPDAPEDQQPQPAPAQDNPADLEQPPAQPQQPAPPAEKPAPPPPPPPAPSPPAADVKPASSSPLKYSSNALMKASIFPKTPEGYPLFTAPSTPRYSSFYCIGGRGRLNTHVDRSCRWQNLCYKPSTETWLFYQDPATNGSMPILLDHGLIITEFPREFLNLRSMGNPQDAEYWAPVQVYEDIPDGALVKRRHSDRADVYLLYRSHYPSNIGHVLGDDFFPLFNLQLSFNMLSNDNTLIMSKSCDRIFLPHAPGKAAACTKFIGMLTPGMTDQPVLAATDATFAESLGVKGDLVCFENLLTGNGPWGFQQSLGKAPSWWQYHSFYLSNMGLNPNHTPKKHRITVSIKDGKRSIFNHQDMVDHLRSAFPDFTVDAIELYTLGGWREELAYLLDTTVLITPCGGVSMSAMFLPRGSALVVVDYWDVNKGNSVGMEERLWSNLGYVRPFHYPFTEEEVVLAEEEGGKKLSRKARQDMRDWGRVKVDLQRMERIVRAAIAHVDSFMIKGQE